MSNLENLGMGVDIGQTSLRSSKIGKDLVIPEGDESSEKVGKRTLLSPGSQFSYGDLNNEDVGSQPVLSENASRELVMITGRNSTSRGGKLEGGGNRGGSVSSIIDSVLHSLIPSDKDVLQNNPLQFFQRGILKKYSPS